MAQQRLLERLKNMENNTPLTTGTDVQSEIQSILDHLQCLLNTRCGTVLIDEDYGIPDVFFTQGTSFKENTQTMMQLMTETIKKYEPRLSQVSIVAKERQRALLEQHFTLSATLTRDPDLSIELNVVISSDGKIKTNA